MPRLRNVSSRIRTPRRQTGWGGGPASGTDGAAGSLITVSSSVLGSVVSTPTIDGLTLVRTRGEFMFRLLTASVAGDGYFGAVGLAIFNDTALAAGVGSVNTPITDEAWDGWLWHRYFACLAQGAITAAGSSLSAGQQEGVSAAVRVEVDSKAMRKIPVGMSLAVVLQVTEDATAVGVWSFNSRTLSKLP